MSRGWLLGRCSLLFFVGSQRERRAAFTFAFTEGLEFLRARAAKLLVGAGSFFLFFFYLARRTADAMRLLATGVATTGGRDGVFGRRLTAVCGAERVRFYLDG